MCVYGQDEESYYKDWNGKSFATFVRFLFEYKLFDKRKALRVNRKELHIRFPFLIINMPNKMVYSTISAEIFRICRATMGFIGLSTNWSLRP